MLYTDGPFISIADLIQIDPGVVSVCKAESVDIEGVIREAIEEIADRIIAGMQSWGTLYRNSGVSFAHSMAVRGYSSEVNVPRVNICQVVVTANQFINPLKRVVCHTALYNLYRGVSNRKSEDKYKDKAKIYEAGDRKYWNRFILNGLPVVLNPLSCPASVYGMDYFTVSDLGDTTMPGTFDVVLTYQRGDVESGPSPALQVGNGVFQVDISGLNPPSDVTSWNIYADSLGQTPLFQANVDIATTGTSLTFAPNIRRVGSGQEPDCNLVFQDLIMRA